MKIIFKESFVRRLENQVDYIAADSPARARKFKTALINRIKQIPSNPTQNRKSVYFEDNNIRDLIFKGYVIVYRITETSIEIFVLSNTRILPLMTNPQKATIEKK